MQPKFILRWYDKSDIAPVVSVNSDCLFYSADAENKCTGAHKALASRKCQKCWGKGEHLWTLNDVIYLVVCQCVQDRLAKNES